MKKKMNANISKGKGEEMTKEELTRLFGIAEIEEIFRKKEGTDKHERAASSKVSKVNLTEDECRKLCKSVGLEFLDGYEARVLQYCMTDETVDRYGDIVMAKGGDLSQYKKNPVVLTFHNGHTFPVGNSIKTWYDKEQKAVMGWVLFFDERVDPSGIADTAFRFASSGAMKYGSIGFITKKSRRPDEKEQEVLGIPAYGVIFEEWELLEFSLTPVPANPNAGQREVEIIRRGFYTKENINDPELTKYFPKETIQAIRDIVNPPEPVVPLPDQTIIELVKEVKELVKAVSDLVGVMRDSSPALPGGEQAIENDAIELDGILDEFHRNIQSISQKG